MKQTTIISGKINFVDITIMTNQSEFEIYNNFEFIQPC